jgi:hypothetical protein
MNTRRAVLRRLALAGWMGAPAGAAFAAPGHAGSLRHPVSLADELRRAVGARKALVVLVSLEGCPYCKLVRDAYLAPMGAAGQPVVQLELAAAIPLRDGAGRASTHAQVVRAWDVRLAPTVLFLGRGWAEVADRLVGVASPDFYGAYLQERLDTANRTVERR